MALAFDDSPLRAELTVYTYMVERGKPAAMLPIPERYIDEAIAFVHSISKMKTFTEELGEEWRKLWIYQYEYIQQIIIALPQTPETVFDHWALGKLFGYDELSIAKYISKVSDS